MRAAIAARLGERPVATLAGARVLPPAVVAAHAHAAVTARRRGADLALALVRTTGPARPTARVRIAATRLRAAVATGLQARSRALLAGARVVPLTVAAAGLRARCAAV